MATHQKAHIKTRGTKELITKDSNEEYAEVIRPVGDARFECQLLNGNKVMGKLTGRLIKGPNKQRITPGDLILLQLDTSSSDSSKYYILHKYSPDDRKKLAKKGELVQIQQSEDVGTNIIMEGDVTSKTVVEEEENMEDFIDNI